MFPGKNTQKYSFKLYGNIASNQLLCCMRKIKASNSYAKSQTRKNLAKAVLCLLILGAALFAISLRVLSTWQLGLLEQAGLIFLLVPLVAFYFYLRKYRIYSGGLKVKDK